MSYTNLPCLRQPTHCNTVKSHDDSEKRVPVIVLFTAARDTGNFSILIHRAVQLVHNITCAIERFSMMCHKTKIKTNYSDQSQERQSAQ